MLAKVSALFKTFRKSGHPTHAGGGDKDGRRQKWQTRYVQQI